MVPGIFLACRFAPRFRGNPFLRAAARQEFLPPNSLALSRFSRRVAACENRSAAPAAARCFVHWTHFAAAAPGDKMQRRTAHSARRASHTLCAAFPWLCPARMHMSSGRDFFDSLMPGTTGWFLAFLFGARRAEKRAVLPGRPVLYAGKRCAGRRRDHPCRVAWPDRRRWR